MKKNSVVALACLLLLGCTSNAFGWIEPSFLEELCAWHATHIVVVTEGEKIDGIVEVQDSWKGDLKKGSVLTVPELASFAAEKKRVIADRLFEKAQPMRPTHVSGTRMILFLIKEQPKDPPGKAARTTWKPANVGWNRMWVSVAWVERGEVYAFRQQINPGDSELVGLDQPESNVKSRVLRICKIQDDLTKAIALSDQSKIAKAVQPAIHFDSEFVKGGTLKTLGKSGNKGLPILRELLKDESLAETHDGIIRAMVEAGGADVGPDLIAVVEQQLDFWKKTGPSLKPEWWNGGGDLKWAEVQRLRDRYCKTLAAIEALGELRFSRGRKAVIEFRDFWRSLPQLEEIDQMSKECDESLKKHR